MRTHFACGHCRTINRFTSYSARYWRENNQAAAQRCVNCGATHGCRNYEADVISPIIQPMVRGNLRLSPWYPAEYRPIIAGHYECEFRDMDGALWLWWNGSYFQIDAHDARRVDVRTLYKWRGVWA